MQRHRFNCRTFYATIRGAINPNKTNSHTTSYNTRNYRSHNAKLLFNSCSVWQRRDRQDGMLTQNTLKESRVRIIIPLESHKFTFWNWRNHCQLSELENGAVASMTFSHSLICCPQQWRMSSVTSPCPPLRPSLQARLEVQAHQCPPPAGLNFPASRKVQLFSDKVHVRRKKNDRRKPAKAFSTIFDF